MASGNEKLNPIQLHYESIRLNEHFLHQREMLADNSVTIRNASLVEL